MLNSSPTEGFSGWGFPVLQVSLSFCSLKTFLYALVLELKKPQNNPLKTPKQPIAYPTLPSFFFSLSFANLEITSSNLYLVQLHVETGLSIFLSLCSKTSFTYLCLITLGLKYLCVFIFHDSLHRALWRHLIILEHNGKRGDGVNFASSFSSLSFHFIFFHLVGKRGC